MPVTDLLDGGDDWLQQFLAGHMAGQAFGANQGGGGYPTMGLRPPEAGGTPGQVSGRVGYGLPSQTMPTGAPSMGYPALGQPSAQPPPAAAPGPAQGLSLTSNPIARVLNAINPIGSAQAGELSFNDQLRAQFKNAMAGEGINVLPNSARPPPSGSPLPPTARDALPLAFGLPTSDDYQKWLQSQNLSPATTTPPFQQPAHPSTMRFPSWPTGPGASAPASTTTAPPSVPVSHTPIGGGAGMTMEAPTGSPSQTPRPGGSSSAGGSPFAMIDRVNAGPLAQPRRGYQTALDLSQFFRRG